MQSQDYLIEGVAWLNMDVNMANIIGAVNVGIYYC